MDRTLTRITKSAKESLDTLYGYSFCYEDAHEILADKTRRTSADSALLNEKLELLGVSTDGIKSANDYRNAFRALVISDENPNGLIYRTRREWNRSLWKKLGEMCSVYSHPVRFMERTVNALGNAAFERDSLRLRILKQMLLCINFSSTGIDLGPLKQYNTGDIADLAELDDKVFDTSFSYAISPAEDIRALAKIFGGCVVLENNKAALESVLLCLTDSARSDYSSGKTSLLEFIDTAVSSGMELDGIFDTESHDIEAVRTVIKTAVKTVIDSFEFAKKDVIDSFPRISKPVHNIKAYKYIMEHTDEFLRCNSVLHCICDDKLSADLTAYKNDPEAEICYDDEVLYKKCFDSYTAWFRECYEYSKSLNVPKRKYHDRGGEWIPRERHICELVRYCDYLATGGNTELDPIFAKTALYLFAFAFGMRYYPDKDIEYDSRRDIQKNLFVDFYNDNIIQFMGNSAARYEREPSGIGINAKNYIECVYLYFLGREDIPIRRRFRSAQKLLNRIEHTSTAGSNDGEKAALTRVYRDEYLPELLAAADEEQLVELIVSKFTVVRTNKSTSPLKLCDGSASALNEYNEIMNHIKNTLRRNIGNSNSDYDTLFAELVYDTKASIITAYEASKSDDDICGFIADAVIDRLDFKELTEVNEKNITRSKLISLHFIYFCLKFENLPKSFEDTYEYFKGSADIYLEAAGYQPVSPRNIYDIILVTLAFGYINNIID